LVLPTSANSITSKHCIMRRNHYAIVLAVLFCMVFIACNHYDRSRSLRAYFFNSSNADHNYHLYINGRDEGRLPYQPRMLKVNRRTVPHAREALYIKLPSGRYSIKVKDETGETVYSEKFKLRLSANSVSVSSNTWHERRARTKQETGNGTLVKQIYFED
jgi:hypothetical protein